MSKISFGTLWSTLVGLYTAIKGFAREAKSDLFAETTLKGMFAAFDRLCYQILDLYSESLEIKLVAKKGDWHHKYANLVFHPKGGTKTVKVRVSALRKIDDALGSDLIRRIKNIMERTQISQEIAKLMELVVTIFASYSEGQLTLEIYEPCVGDGRVTTVQFAGLNGYRLVRKMLNGDWQLLSSPFEAGWPAQVLTGEKIAIPVSELGEWPILTSLYEVPSYLKSLPGSHEGDFDLGKHAEETLDKAITTQVEQILHELGMDGTQVVIYDNLFQWSTPSGSENILTNGVIHPSGKIADANYVLDYSEEKNILHVSRAGYFLHMPQKSIERDFGAESLRQALRLTPDVVKKQAEAVLEKLGLAGTEVRVTNTGRYLAQEVEIPSGFYATDGEAKTHVGKIANPNWLLTRNQNLGGSAFVLQVTTCNFNAKALEEGLRNIS